MEQKQAKMVILITILSIWLSISFFRIYDLNKQNESLKNLYEEQKRHNDLAKKAMYAYNNRLSAAPTEREGLLTFGGGCSAPNTRYTDIPQIVFTGYISINGVQYENILIRFPPSNIENIWIKSSIWEQWEGTK